MKKDRQYLVITKTDGDSFTEPEVIKAETLSTQIANTEKATGGNFDVVVLHGFDLPADPSDPIDAAAAESEMFEVRSYFGRITAKPNALLAGGKSINISSRFESRADAVNWVRAIKDGQRDRIARSEVCPSFDEPEIPAIYNNPAASFKLDNLECFNFEIYVKNPETGESGWDIEHVNAFGVTKADAIEHLRSYPNYDCVITATESWNGCKLDEADVAAFAAGQMFRKIEGRN